MITVAAWAINNRNAIPEEDVKLGETMAVAYLTGIIDMAALYKEFSEKGELLETMRRIEDKLDHYLKIEEEDEDEES